MKKMKTLKNKIIRSIYLSVLTLVSALLLCGCDVSDYFDEVYTTESLISEGGEISQITPAPKVSSKPKETPTPETPAAEVEPTVAPETPAAEVAPTVAPETPAAEVTTDYRFRNKKLLSQHYEKHGIEMGFASAKEYEQAASDVINNPNALNKIEQEDGDYVYYVEATNEFVVLSTDGFIRTYFLPDSGKRYYDKQ